MSHAGYDVSTFLLDAKSFGLAQSRKRLYIICSRVALGLRISSPPVLPKRTLTHVLKKPAVRAYGRAYGHAIRAFCRGSTIKLEDGSAYTMSSAELKQLQGFPAAFSFARVQQKTSVGRLIGNAAPPAVVGVLFLWRRSRIGPYFRSFKVFFDPNKPGAKASRTSPRLIERHVTGNVDIF